MDISPSLTTGRQFYGSSSHKFLNPSVKDSPDDTYSMVFVSTESADSMASTPSSSLNLDGALEAGGEEEVEEKPEKVEEEGGV